MTQQPDTLIRYPLQDNVGFVALVDGMQTGLGLKVVNSARISYGKKSLHFKEEDEKLCQYLWANGHHSPYRHTYLTFHIKSPLFVFRQWVKYQVGSGWRKFEVDGEAVSLEAFDLMFDTDKGCSWNEISFRYSPAEPEFYVPTVMRTNPSHGNKQASVDLPDTFDHERERAEMLDDCKVLYEKYKRRIEAGIARELARTLLPQNVYTQAYWTVSLQGLLHMLQQRMHKDAQFEIRQYANAIYDIMVEAYPDFASLCKISA